MGTMKAADLHRIVTEAALFTGNDSTLPMLTAVKIEINGKKIVAVATDRFTLGVSKAEYTGTKNNAGEADSEIAEEWSFMLYPDEYKQLLQAAKTAKAQTQWREVAIKRADNGFVVFEFSVGAEIRLREADVEFPKYRQLFPSVDDFALSEPVNVQAVDAKHFAKFAKVDDGGNGKSTRVKWVSIRAVEKRGTTDQREVQKPSICTIGENFVGLIMPIRLPDEDNGRYKLEYPDWLL